MSNANEPNPQNEHAENGPTSDELTDEGLEDVAGGQTLCIPPDPDVNKYPPPAETTPITPFKI